MRTWRVVLLIAVIIALAVGVGYAQQAGTFPITGKVLQPNGSPAAGATVEARSLGEDVGWMTGATAVATGDGSFTLQLKPGDYRLAATLGSLACLGDGMNRLAQDGKVSGPIELRLDKGCTVDGTVVDKATGQPLAGVELTTRDGDRAESSASGAWSMVLPQGNHTITAVKDGYAWPIVNFTASAATVKVKVELKPGGTITGRVTDEQGKPVPGATIGVHNSGYFRMRRAKTDKDGRFVLHGQDLDAKVMVWAEATGYEGGDSQPVTFATGQREAQTDFKMTRSKYRTITGRVTEPDGTPIKGAKVAYADGAESANRVCAWSNKDGVYTIKKAGVAKSLVTVTCKDYAPSYEPVEADINAQMDFQLKPGHMVEVKVEDEAGNPVPEAGVGAYMKITNARGDEDLYGIAYDTSDKNGHFKLDSLPEGEVYATIIAGGYKILENERLEVDRTDYTLVMRKEISGQICGTVLKDADGQPITEFNVRLGFSRNGGRSSSGLAPGLVEQGVSFQAKDGRFVIKGLSPKDSFAVFVNAPGYMEASVDPVTVKLASEMDHKQTVVRLRPSRSFEGTITAKDTGAPIEGVLVSAYNTVGRSAGSMPWDMSHSIYKGISTRTDATGKFRFDSMPFSFGMIMLEKPGFARTMLASVNFHQPLTAAMGKGAAISGSIADAQGKVPPDVWLNLTHKELDLRFSELRPQPDGSFSEKDLPAGEYMLAQYENGSLTRSLAFEVKPGEALQVDWHKQGPVFVHGKVVQRGKPIAGALISVNSRRGGMTWEGSTSTAKDGTYTISLLKPGVCRFSCMVGKWDAPDRINADRECELKIGQNTVDFSLPCGSISGKLVDSANGKPLTGAAVSLFVRETYADRLGRASLTLDMAEPAWWGEARCTTDKNGSFQAKSLKAGKWMVCVGPGAIPAAIVTLGDGETKSGVIAKSRKTGSAEIKLIGIKQLPRYSLVTCTDGYGRVYYPKLVKGAWTLQFDALPVGRLRAVCCIHSYLPSVADFEVRPGRTTTVPIKLVNGSRIVFKAKLDSGDAAFVHIGFRITTPDGKPVYMTPQGLCWGGILTYDRQKTDSDAINVKPGKYLIKAGAEVAGNQDYVDDVSLGGFSGVVTVVKGKDTIVEVPLNK